MSFYPIIVIACIAFYGGYYFYTKRRNAQQAEKVNATDFKREFKNAEKYKDKYSHEMNLSVPKQPQAQKKPMKKEKHEYER